MAIVAVKEHWNLTIHKDNGEENTVIINGVCHGCMHTCMHDYTYSHSYIDISYYSYIATYIATCMHGYIAIAIL